MAESRIDLDVDLSARFKAIRAQLREADRALRLEFLARIRLILAPLGPEITQSALRKLPKRGGLARKIADSDYSIRTRVASVVFKTTNPYEIKDFDEGLIRHPVFAKEGKREVWVDQKITPHFWSEPVEAIHPVLFSAVEKLLDETVHKIERI